ncbi:hypothetical protein JOM56_014482 [Amanita muscaria]
MNGTNDDAGDIILQSTDNDYLRTSKVMLSNASELFKTIFSLPQPPDQDSEFIRDGLAVIPIDADTSLLQNLLLFCNPAPEMVRLPELQRAAMKYQLYEVAKRILKERTRGIPNIIPPTMLASIEKNINSDARLAAVFTMSFPDDNSDDVVDMGLITKAQADSLLTYQRNCVAAAVKVASPDHGHYKWMSEVWTRSNWFKDDGGEHEHCCNRGGNIYIGNTHGKWMMRHWWREYMYAARDELQKQPCGSAVLSGEIFQRALKEGSRCRKCSPDLGSQLRVFAALFAGEIDKAVSSVSGYKYFT